MFQIKRHKLPPTSNRSWPIQWGQASRHFRSACLLCCFLNLPAVPHAARCFHPDQDIQPDKLTGTRPVDTLNTNQYFLLLCMSYHCCHDFWAFFLPSTDLHKLDYGKQSMCFHIKTSFKPPSSQSLNNNPSLCVWLSVFGEKKIFRAVNSTHFWAQSSSLFGSLLDNVESGWVFTHCPVSFQAATQAEDVVKSHTGPDLSIRGGSRPLIVWWDYWGTKEAVNLTKTLEERQKEQLIHVASDKYPVIWP